MTLQIRDQRGTVSLRYRNRAENTVLMREEEPLTLTGKVFMLTKKTIQYSVEIALNTTFLGEFLTGVSNGSSGKLRTRILPRT